MRLGVKDDTEGDEGLGASKNINAVKEGVALGGPRVHDVGVASEVSNLFARVQIPVGAFHRCTASLREG